MKILLQPASQGRALKHFEDTVQNGVLLGSLEGRISQKEFSELQSLGSDLVRVWGFTPDLNGQAPSAWAELSGGDLVLFYKLRSFYYLSKVFFKIHNPDLAREWWGVDDEGRTWEYIYFILQGEQIEIPFDPSVLGYKENYIQQKTQLLTDEQTANMLDYIQGFQSGQFTEDITPTYEEEAELTRTIRTPRSAEEAEIEIERLSQIYSDKPVKERVKLAKVLSRNSQFARLVKENAKYICEICGTEPFEQKSGLPYAEAHHTEELSKTKIDSPNKMICVCPTCHRVIHYGSEAALKAREALKG